MKIIYSLFAVVTLVAMVGCDSGTPQTKAKAPGGVALIDLDIVAKRLGRDTEIDAELKTAGDDLGAKLATAQKDLQEEFLQLKQSLGEKPTSKQNQQLADRGRELNEKFQQAEQSARQEIASQRTDLIVRFREEIRPIALRIAAERGLTTVLVKSDIVVLANDPSVDITDTVAAELVGQTKPAPSPDPASESPAGDSN